MKTWICIVALALAGSVAASGQVLRSIDTRKMADDVNGKMFGSGNLELKVINPATVDFNQSPLSGKGTSFGRVEMPAAETHTVETPAAAQPVVPQVNFEAKRAAESGKVRAEKAVPAQKAPVKDHTIHANTPAGQEELKKVLNTSP